MSKLCGTINWRVSSRAHRRHTPDIAPPFPPSRRIRDRVWLCVHIRSEPARVRFVCYDNLMVLNPERGRNPPRACACVLAAYGYLDPRASTIEIDPFAFVRKTLLLSPSTYIFDVYSLTPPVSLWNCVTRMTVTGEPFKRFPKELFL